MFCFLGSISEKKKRCTEVIRFYNGRSMCHPGLGPTAVQSKPWELWVMMSGQIRFDRTLTDLWVLFLNEWNIKLDNLDALLSFCVIWILCYLFHGAFFTKNEANLSRHLKSIATITACCISRWHRTSCCLSLYFTDKCWVVLKPFTAPYE